MHQLRRGFTIVELLVVIAIVVALAMITIFAFGSWRQRTANSEVQNELYTAASTLKNYRTFNNTYPAALADMQYSANNNVTLVYTLRGGGASYCLSATSKAVTSVVMYIDSANGSTPVATACS